MLRPKLLLMTNRKLHMHFRLAPRSMTLDDLELENNRFSSFNVYSSQTVYAPLSRAYLCVSCAFLYTGKYKKWNIFAV